MFALVALAKLLIGFSVFSAGLLVLLLRPQNQRIQILSSLLLVLLVIIQLINFAHLEFASTLVHSTFYNAVLFAVAPSFYLLTAPILTGQVQQSVQSLWHYLAVVLAILLPINWGLPLAFIIGAGYVLSLAQSVYALREQRSRFQLELFGLALMFILASLVVLLGISQSFISDQAFFSLYASAVGGAFLVATTLLIRMPQLPTEVAEAAHETYAVSTLGKIDCAAVEERLAVLMKSQQLYTNPDLDLPQLAAALGLTHYQLSELLNTRLGKGFSRYLREQRIEAAKQQLIAEPKATILGIGLAVGFSSQSNFYEAFREIVGMTPGQFRKLQIKNTPD